MQTKTILATDKTTTLQEQLQQTRQNNTLDKHDKTTGQNTATIWNFPKGHNDAWRKLRSIINPRKRSEYPTLTTTDEHNNVTIHTTTEQKLDAFAGQLTKTFGNRQYTHTSGLTV